MLGGRRVQAKRMLLALVAALLPAALGPALADDGDALVIVNGQPISRQKVVDVLMDTHGLQIMQQVIALELAKQETRRLGIQISAADVEEQYRRAVEEIAPTRDATGVTLSEEQKRQALEKVLRDKCLSLGEFRVAMERNAHLRKVADQGFHVDEATLREEFARTRGEKAEVRHIVVHANDKRTLQEALDRLNQGEDFAEVARRLSTNPETAARGGLMEPFTFTDKEVPPAVREVVFALRPGQVSNPTAVGELIHVFKLERRIPPEDVRFEDVREQVEAELRERVVRQKMGELMTKIFDQAKIRVLDPKLKREFDEMLKQRGGVQSATP
jgi:foldase protein PrsA